MTKDILIRYACVECDARPPRGDYMVHDAIWANAGMSRRGFLCLSCLEKRLIAAGHGPLCLDDFIEAPCNAGIRFGYAMARKPARMTADLSATDNFVAFPRNPTQMETIETSPKTLTTQDIESWAVFLPTVHVGGALPVTFRADGDHVVVEVVVPFVPPEPQLSADPNRSVKARSTSDSL